MSEAHLVPWSGARVHNTVKLFGLIDANVTIGRDTKIWAFTHVGRDAAIGERCTIGEAVHVGPKVVIGNGCKIQNGAQLFEGVTLEDDVFVGPHVVFTNVTTPRAFIPRRHEFKPTLVKKGASIGANATILCGVTIGEYAMIGAGAVVTKPVPAHALVVGNPARQAGWVCRCGLRVFLDYRNPRHGGEGTHTCQCGLVVVGEYAVLYPYGLTSMKVADATTP